MSFSYVNCDHSWSWVATFNPDHFPYCPKLRSSEADGSHDDVIKWKHFPRYWPFVREIHRSSVNFPHKGQWRGALMFSLICAWINGWVNNRDAGHLRRHRAHYDVTVMGESRSSGGDHRWSWVLLISLRRTLLSMCLARTICISSRCRCAYHNLVS